MELRPQVDRNTTDASIITQVCHDAAPTSCLMRLRAKKSCVHVSGLMAVPLFQPRPTLTMLDPVL